MQTYIQKNKKNIKKIFFIPAAIVGIGVLSVAVGGMACMGGAVFVCYIVMFKCLIQFLWQTLNNVTYYWQPEALIKLIIDFKIGCDKCYNQNNLKIVQHMFSVIWSFLLFYFLKLPSAKKSYVFGDLKFFIFYF